MKTLFMLGCLARLAWGSVENREYHYRELEELKMEHRFGIGVSAGGPLAVLGLEADVNINSQLSVSGGLGTGLDYSTFMVKARYFLPGKWVSPYAAFAVARWWTDATRDRNIGPSVLLNKFLAPEYNPTDGFSVFLFSPSIGVQIMHPMGVAFFAELQYLFKFFSLANGTYAGLGAHWYF